MHNYDGSLTSDNDTAQEDETDLDIPKRKKKSSRYSSKRHSQQKKNKDGYSSSQITGGGYQNDSEADDEAHSNSTHGLYDGSKPSMKSLIGKKHGKIEVRRLTDEENNGLPNVEILD